MPLTYEAVVAIDALVTGFVLVNIVPSTYDALVATDALVAADELSA